MFRIFLKDFIALKFGNKATAEASNIIDMQILCKSKFLYLCNYYVLKLKNIFKKSNTHHFYFPAIFVPRKFTCRKNP